MDHLDFVTATTLTFSLSKGFAVAGQLISATQFSAPTLGTGTVTNGKILWTNGTTWSGFNICLLNSMFASVKGYPFP